MMAYHDSQRLGAVEYQPRLPVGTAVESWIVLRSAATVSSHQRCSLLILIIAAVKGAMAVETLPLLQLESWKNRSWSGQSVQTRSFLDGTAYWKQCITATCC